MRIIEEVVFQSTSRDPMEIAELMMSFPGLPMLGCHHAYIAGGALMAAIKNEASRGITNEDIKEVFRRTKKQAHGGFCGLTGVCGVVPAIGAVFAVLTGSKCGTDSEQRITMEATARLGRAIAELTGPSCCKAYVRTSLEVAIKYLKESLGIELPLSSVSSCIYSARHPHGCRELNCPYFSKTAADVNKPANTNVTTNGHSIRDFSSKEDAMNFLLQKSLEFGAEKAKIIDTDTVVVEEWVRWKCQYGCPLYDKDAFHPPCAPDAESTKKVLKEYSKAILINGPKGKALSEVAVRLEDIAYHMGYYKAFALTALSSGLSGVT
ncbi:MAG: hypothetical protein GXO97_05045 [Nitrospirae bacterium]|nr:hypothetical protein [Nitrospirota bacterium]